MDTFITNVTDIGWWLGHIPAALVALAIGFIIKRIPVVAKNISKLLKIRELKRIRRQRFNYSAVTYEIVKSHSLMILFTGLCITYIFIFSKANNSSENWLIILIKSSPLYVIEIMFLLQREYTKKLIKNVGKIIVTKRKNGPI